MVPIRRGAFIRKVKDITLSSTLTLSLLTGATLMPGCDSSSNSDADQSEYAVSYTQGIETRLKESADGEFKIMEERVVPEGETKAIVEYLDGRVDTLNIEQARRIATADTTEWQGNEQNRTENNGAYYGGYYGGGLGNALFYGSMGYFLGRSLNSQPVSRYYASPDVYTRAQQNTSTVQSSRVARPTNSSKGYFRSGTRGSGAA